MFKALSSWFGFSLCILGYFCATTNPALAEARLALEKETTPRLLAQVTSDDTVNTEVTENGNTAEITGGETRGDNLFHSFQNFSVETGNEASFLNANDISNIFSRVTGGDISNIDGLISANGSANLFLINPAGIVFGEGARLDIGGSFYGSTADSILFEDGEFSATDLENTPVLTINAPIGLNLRDQPADIVNRSVVEDSTGEFVVGLEVAPGNNLAFIGGDITFEGSNATAKGGNIELGGLSAAGTVGINPDGSLSFPEAVARADVNLTAAYVDVAGTGSGSIIVNSRNLNLETGEINGDVFASALGAGITADSTSPEAQAGDITIKASESINLDNSFISNNVEAEGEGNSGAINLTTPNLSLANFSSISADTFGQGNAGSIDINAANLSLTNLSSIKADTLGQGNAGFIDINASASITLNNSSISNTISFGGVGDGGEVNINTPNLSLANGSSIDADTFGQGNAGSIDINATKLVTLDDFSSISSTLSSDLTANGGKVNITTPNLSLTKDSSIEANAYGAGNGNGGLIDINATESVTLDDFSSISGTAGFDEEKNNGGEININTPNLSLTKDSSIDANAYGAGDAGLVNINATESVTFNDSDISSTSGVDQTGNGGEININTPNLSLTNFSSIDANTFGQGKAGKLTITSANISLTDLSSISADTFGEEDGGSVNINATESIALNESFISSSVTFEAEGNGGDLNITTPNLSLTNFSSIDADTSGQGNAGVININAPESITLNNSSISSTVQFLDVEGNGGNIQISTGDFSISNNASVKAGTSGIGNGGEINITANNLSLTNGGNIFASTSGPDAENIAEGDGGNINIDVADTLSIDSKTTGDFGTAGIFASNQGDSSGNAGNIDITTSKLSLMNGSQINSFTRGSGNAGNTTINAQDSIFLSGEDSEGFPSAVLNSVDNETASGNGGTISITTKKLDLVDGANISTFSIGKGDAGLIDINANVVALDNGDISAEAFNQANGGNLEIDADAIVAFPGGDSNIFASAEQGNGGNITINAESVLGIEERPLNDFTNDISASSEVSGFDGTVNIETSDINPVQGATELPSNVVEPEQTTAQTCSAGRGTANNGLAIAGKGGVPPAPDTPLNSENIISSEQNSAAFDIPEPIETSQGKIQPARGIKVSKSGKISLTAYRTNNAGERIPEIQPNCN